MRISVVGGRAHCYTERVSSSLSSLKVVFYVLE